MRDNLLPHVWTVYGESRVARQWICIKGARPECMVRTIKMDKGYMWQHGKQAGWCKSIEEAKDVAEAAREFWPRLIY